MGNEGNESLKDIGANANKQSPTSFINSSVINLTNSTIIGENTTDPENDYKKLHQLGQGTYGSVFEIQNRTTDIIRAMKVVKKNTKRSAEEEKEILHEENILRTMDHPNIVKIFEFYSNDENYSIITENCKGGSLYKEIEKNGPFNENYTAYVMYQLFSAIHYYNGLNIIHRDLRPENILIANKNKSNNFPNIKICDFGMSKIVDNTITTENKIVGSLYYLAPEVLDKNYNEKCDLWSCGVIMYYLLTKKFPFSGVFKNEITEKIKKGEFDIESPNFDKISPKAKDLLQKLLTVDVNKRINIKDALNHPWLEERNSKELYNQILDKKIVEKLLNNLKKYKKHSIIQETALAFLVHNFPQMKDVVNACKLFNQIDLNGDGKITGEELYLGLKKRLNSDTLIEDVKNIFSNLDMNNDGYIEYEEFVRASVSKEKFMGENVLKFAFRYFDKDDSGKITFKEIETVFKNSVTDKEHMEEALNKIIFEVDINRDGKISFEEFSKVMKKMLD